MSDAPLVYSIRELNQHTARVLAEIQQSGQPAFITRQGRYAFMIKPVDPQLEARVLAEMAEQA